VTALFFGTIFGSAVCGINLGGFMKRMLTCLHAGLLSGVLLLGAQSPAPTEPLQETTTPDIPGVVKSGTRVQILKRGFNGTEGPIADKEGNLLFTEQNANKIIKVGTHGNFSTFLENSNRTIGLGWDKKGRLIAAESAPGKVQLGVLYPMRETLVNEYQGQAIGRVNDLVIDKKGGIYFPDAVLAANQQGTPPYKPCLWYYTPDKKLIKITEEVPRPNGIILSPDGKVLYADNGAGEYLLAFDVKPDGTVGKAKNFARLEAPPEPNARPGGDGMTVDAGGRVYVATRLGAQVVGPDGKHLGTIRIPSQTQNMAFGGPGKKTLYVVGGGNVYKIETLTHGLPYPAK
jgi:gluconolactonase